jgi:P4 family phage/plasmid primase-like protien
MHRELESRERNAPQNSGARKDSKMHEERTTVLQDHYNTAGEGQSNWLPITFFDNTKDNRVDKQARLPWADVVPLLKQHVRREEKDGPLFAPAQFRDGGKRRDADVEALSMLVLDFDDGTPPKDVTTAWEQWEYVIYSTHSHMEDGKPKWRAVFPLTGAVPASEWEATYSKLARALGAGHADLTCRNAGRMFYLPSCPKEREALAFAEHHPGRPLDPNEVPEPPKEVVEKAERKPLPAGAKGDYKTLDVVALFEAHGLYGRCIDPAEGRHAVLCPWVDEHTQKRPPDYGDTVVWEADGEKWPRFHCSHKHCEGRRIEDVIALWADADAFCAEEFVRRPRATEYPLTDYGNAERLVKCHGANLRYCEAWGKWLVWDDSRWAVDRTGEVMRRAKFTVRAFIREALDIDDDTKRQAYLKHLLKSESERALRAMIALAQSEPGIPVVPEKLDTHEMLLNCKNGTLDLTTGELRPHRREDMITKMVPVEYDPTAECPTVDRFIADIFGNDPEMVAYIWRALGYALTGSVKERVMFILWGAKGNNGKTTLLELLADVLCDYSAKVRADTLMIKRGDSIPNDIAALKGARFVFSSEGEENRRLAEALVKEITGGDTIAARFMRAEWFYFKPEFKLFFATNHKPVIRGTDNAIWKRLHLIPFEERFVEEPEAGEHPIDKDLPAKLRAELPGFLARMVKGCLEWQEKGLCPPVKVQAATKEYRAEMDVLADWIAECCVVHTNAKAAPTPLYESYSKWCVTAGETPMNRRSFSDRLRERGFAADRTGRQRFYKGIGLRAGEGVGPCDAMTDGDAISGISAYKNENRDYTENCVTSRHASPPAGAKGEPADHQAPVDAPGRQEEAASAAPGDAPSDADAPVDEEIGTCACGRPADRFTATGEPICSACVEGASARQEEFPPLTDDDFIFGDDLSDMIITDDDVIDDDAKDDEDDLF